MRFGVAVFPGTWSDRDCAHAVELAGHEAVMLWHKDADLRGADFVILPGGFSYGGHLRCGALTRNASLQFRCEPAWLRVETTNTPYTAGSAIGEVLQVPVSHGEGRYVADDATLAQLESDDRVVFRY